MNMSGIFQLADKVLDANVPIWECFLYARFRDSFFS